MDSRYALAKKGVFLGGCAPFGYDIVDQKYVINPREASAVCLVFESYANGKSYKYILDELIKLGFTKGKRGRELKKNTLHFILKNPRYTGRYAWMEHVNQEMYKWMGRKKNDNAVILDDIIPQIIDKELFMKVQERMNENKHFSSNNRTREYLLSGLIHCNDCSNKFIGRTTTSGKGNKSSAYTCEGRYRDKICKMQNFNADEIESKIREEIKKWTKRVDVGEFSMELDKHKRVYKKDDSKERDEYLQVQREIFNMTNAIKKGIIYDELMGELETSKARLVELEKILNVNDAKSKTSDIAQIRILEKLKKDIDNIDDNTLDSFIKTFVRQIIAYQDRFEIVVGVAMDVTGIGRAVATVIENGKANRTTTSIGQQYFFVNGKVGIVAKYERPKPKTATHYYNKHTGQFVERKIAVT